MSIKLCLLKTGETIIGDVKEVIDPDENKSLGYKMDAPYIVDYQYEKTLTVDNESIEGDVEETPEKDSQISFKFWAPLSKERDFNFSHEFVEVIYEPHDKIVQSYFAILEHWQTENTQNVTIDTDQTVLTRIKEEASQLETQLKVQPEDFVESNNKL